MNKSIFRKGFVFCAIILIFGTCVISTIGSSIENNNFYFQLSINSNGLILYVGGSGPGNYTKIQDAIDNASEHDIIFVYDDSSPYYENIIVDKPIFIVGENPNTTTIDGNYKKCTVTINTSSVGISDLRIINGNLSGLKIYNSDHCAIYNTIFESNNRYGISLIGSSNNIIGDNHINNNNNGTKISSSSNDNLIYENIFDNNYNGLILESSSGNSIRGNKIINNEYGIKLHLKSRHNKIESNSISYNNLGIFLGGTITPTFGFNILFDGSVNNKIIKNNFIENTQDAFFQNSRRNRWWRNYWNESKILPKIIFGELFICRLQGIPPIAIEHHIPWMPRLDLRPALRPFSI
jgi:parallel beta-helix repeat protein